MGKNRNAGKPVFFSSYDKKHPAHKSANDKYAERQLRNAQSNRQILAGELLMNVIAIVGMQQQGTRPRV